MTTNANVLDHHDQVNSLTCKAKSTPLRESNFNPLNTLDSVQSSSYGSTANISDLRLLRIPEVLAFLGIAKSTLYVQINKGLIPPPISLGERAVAFVMHEIKAILAAKIAGRSNDEIKQLVSRLVSSRQDLYEREVQACNI